MSSGEIDNVKVIDCRNPLEAEFESLITRFINSEIDVDISGNRVESDVKIEDIINFYAQNEESIDSETLIRAFITSAHYAVDDESSRLSRWFVKVDGDKIFKSMTPKVMTRFVFKKLWNLLTTSNDEFIVKYTTWLLESYFDRNTKHANQFVMHNLKRRIHNKLIQGIFSRNNKIQMGRLNSLFESDEDNFLSKIEVS